MAQNKKKGKLRIRAQRDVNVAMQPQLDSLKRMRNQAQDEYGEADQRAQSIYDALHQELAPLGGQYQAANDAITQQYLKDQGQFGGLLGTGSEAGAAANLYGTIGAGGSTLLANNASRQLGYQTSTERQAAIERANVRRNLLEDHHDLLDDLRAAKQDLKGQGTASIMARLDELRQQRTQNRQVNQQFDLNKKQMELQAALAQELAGIARDDLRGLGNRKDDKGGRGKGDKDSGGMGSSGGGDVVPPNQDPVSALDPDAPVNTPQGPGYEPRGAKRYDNLTKSLIAAHEAVTGEWYDYKTKKWYVGGIPHVSTVGARPVRRINQPLGKRRRIVKRNPALEGRKGGK